MANSIALAERYLAVTDRAYKAASKTIDLDFANSDIEFIGANTAKVASVSMDGLGDYDRTTGTYSSGNVTLTWEQFTLANDRSKQLHIDRYDNEETLGQAFDNLAIQFEAEKVVPEIDQYTFARMVTGTTNTVDAAAITVGTTDVAALVANGETILDDAEVPREGRLLFVSGTAYQALKANITRYVQANEGTINRPVEYFDDMKVIVVPKGRFATACTLGTSGYTQSGYQINFIICHPTAIKKAVKHNLPKIFSPDEAQQTDSWLLDYRAYYDAFVLDNKANGIYVHRDTTAL